MDQVFAKTNWPPILLLPDEIICAIFEDLSIMGGFASKMHWDWVTVTYVCRSWRKVALEASILWSLIVSTKLTSVTRTRLFLQRSRNALLTVRLVDKDFDSIKLCLKYIHRIRYLSIEGKFGLVKWAGMPALLGGYAPQLQSVEVVNLSHEEYTAPLQLGSHTANTTDSSHGLRVIRLVGFSLVWNALPLSGLMELSICSISNNIKCPTLSQLIAILGSCPALIKFRMENICITELNIDAATVVELPSLREFHMCNVNPSVLLKLMIHLILPSDVRYAITSQSSSYAHEATSG